MRQDAGLPSLRIPDCRHTWASQGVMNGVGLQTVARSLGHRKRRSTAIYAHLDDAASQDAATQATAAVADAMGYRAGAPPSTDEAQSIETGSLRAHLPESNPCPSTWPVRSRLATRDRTRRNLHIRSRSNRLPPRDAPPRSAAQRADCAMSTGDCCADTVPERSGIRTLGESAFTTLSRFCRARPRDELLKNLCYL